MTEMATASKSVSEQLNQLNTLQQEIKAIFQKRPLKGLQPKSLVYEAMNFILHTLAEILILLNYAKRCSLDLTDQFQTPKEAEPAHKMLLNIGIQIRILSQMIVSTLLLRSKNCMFIFANPETQTAIQTGIYLYKFENQAVGIYLIDEKQVIKHFYISAENANRIFANIRWPGESSKDIHAMVEDEVSKNIIFNVPDYSESEQKIISKLKSVSAIENHISMVIREICEKCCFIENIVLEKNVSLDEQKQINDTLYWGLVDDDSYETIFGNITVSTRAWGFFSTKQEIHPGLRNNFNDVNESIIQMRTLLDPDYKNIALDIQKNGYKIWQISNKGSWSKHPKIPKNIWAPKSIYFYRDSKNEEIIYAVVLHEKKRKELLKFNDHPHYQHYESQFKNFK